MYCGKGVEGDLVLVGSMRNSLYRMNLQGGAVSSKRVVVSVSVTPVLIADLTLKLSLR